MKLTWQRAELLFTLLVVLVVGVALWSSLKFGQRAGLFPWVILVPTLLLALWQLLDDARGKTRTPTEAVGEGGETSQLLPSTERRRELAVVGWILAFLVGIWLLSFPIGSAVLAGVMLRFGSRESWRTSVIYSVCTLLLMEVLFRQQLLIPFPDGAIFEWLGIGQPHLIVRLPR